MLVPLRSIGRGHCHGYQNGCHCTACQQRRKGVASGRLFYDQDGKLATRKAPRQPWESAA
jgi:hypothetical protein